MKLNLYRVKNSKYAMLGGICAGISHNGNVALWVVRSLFLLAIILQPFCLLAYIIMWITLPVKTMTDQEFNIENLTFRDIPSVKPDNKTIKEIDNVIAKIENNIVNEIKNKQKE